VRIILRFAVSYWGLRGRFDSAYSLIDLKRFEEAKSLLRRTLPIARRVFGDNGKDTLMMRKTYALALYKDAGATLDDLREAVATLEETERTGRRVLGGAHPLVVAIEGHLRASRSALRAREAGKRVVFEKTFAKGWLDGPS
jgi:hypothetical protein